MWRFDPSAGPIAGGVLRAFADNVENPPSLNASLRSALASLLENENTRILALPVAILWDRSGILSSQTGILTQALIESLSQSGLPDDQRIQIARSLVSIREKNTSILPTIIGLLQSGSSESLKEGMLAVLGSIGDEDLGQILINQFGSLESAIKLKAFDQIVNRAPWAIQLLEEIDSGRFTPADLGPGNIARLRHHPDRKVERDAHRLFARIAPVSSSSERTISSQNFARGRQARRPRKGQDCSLQHALCVINLVISVQMLAPLSMVWVLMEQPNFLAKSWILIARSSTYFAHNITTKGGETLVASSLRKTMLL